MTSNDNKNQKDAILKLTFSYVGRILSRMQYNQMCCRSAVVKFLLLLETNNLDLKKGSCRQTHCCHFLSLVVTYCHLLSLVVTCCCYLLLLVVTCCYLLLLIVNPCYLWSPVVTCCYFLLSVVLCLSGFVVVSINCLPPTSGVVQAARCVRADGVLPPWGCSCAWRRNLYIQNRRSTDRVCVFFWGDLPALVALIEETTTSKSK